MATDFEIAKELQAKFDKEALELDKLQEEKDLKFARKLSNSEHQLSDSDNDSDKQEKDENLDNISNSSTPNSLNGSSKKPKCKYGKDCYRKNPSHFVEFHHPIREGRDRDEGEFGSNSKRRKLSPSTSSQRLNTPKKGPFDIRLNHSEPFHLFLNKIYSIPETHNDYLSIVFPDLLNPNLGKLKESVQINFMVDLKYVIDFYKAMKVYGKPLLVVYGELEGNPRDYSNVVCNKVQMPFQFGVHHSKMMIFHYDTGIRVVIHTANLIPDDWDEKTQGFWVSPLFPPLENERSSLLEGDSCTNFKKDLVDYLLSYRQPDLTRWTHIIKAHDFSTCKAIFLGSVPGYYQGQNIFKYGHQKVGCLLRRHSSWTPGIASPVIAQCSSIGSLGKDARSWLTGEFGVSLVGGNAGSNSKVHLIYPSEEDVRNSTQGYGGGSCLPYNSNTHLKQQWLKEHMYFWRCRSKKRNHSMPHIKTYTRLSKDLNKAQYFILTSSNLSKAAWGQMQKQGSQFFIRSYEAGVMLLPKFINGEDSFTVMADSNPGDFSLPYDLPLTPYQLNSTPWFMNTPKSVTDNLGNKYP